MNLENMKRILVIRTDRIGDVILSTPTLTALRQAFPSAHIAFMVTPATRELVEDNPYINEVICLDKKMGIFPTISFIMGLRERKFDIALILHSTKRVNLMSFLAGIPIRVGYARGKMDFLLTHRLEYKKKLGEKHESEYTLDILRHIGINALATSLVLNVPRQSEEKINMILKESGIIGPDKIVLIHPAASFSMFRVWPLERFAKVGDYLVKEMGVKVILVSGSEYAAQCEKVKSYMKSNAVSLCGKITLKELAGLCKRSALMISNISGPVHIASAVKTPVICLFGSNAKGLGPKRWIALGEKSIAIHKNVGCDPCLHEKCGKDFLCIRSISVEEVIGAAKHLLR